MVRVVVVTMIPNGGATTRALTKLGFQPYVLSDILKLTGGAHLTRWSSWISGGMRLDQRMFDKHDSVAGPPLAKHILKELHRLPTFTKVILVEEADKMRWQDEMGHRILPALDALDVYVPKSRHIRASKTIVDNMFVLPGNKEAFAAFRKRMAEERVMAEQEMEAQDAAQGDEAAEGADSKAKAEEAKATAAAAAADEAAAAPKASTKSSFAGTTTRISTVSIASEEAAKSAAAEGKAEDPLAAAAAAGFAEGEEGAVGVPGYELVEALEQFEGQIKGTVPKERLLVYREGDGWEPLIEFLGMDPEDIPKGGEFPEFEDGIPEFEALMAKLVAGYERQLKIGRCMIAFCCLALVPWLQWLPEVLSETWEDYKRINVKKASRTVERVSDYAEEAQRAADEARAKLNVAQEDARKKLD